MKILWNFTLRNLKRYTRDKGALFFSLLSVLIIVTLNIIFLADMQIEQVRQTAGNFAGAENLIYAFIIGGLLCVPAVSVPLMLLTFKVNDVMENVQDDLFITPAGRTQIMFGYIFAAWIAGLAMTVVTYMLGEIFILIKGGKLLGLVPTIKVLGVSALTIFAFTGLSFFAIARLKSNTALTVVNTILNTLIGFLAGLYIPLGFLSKGIAAVIKAFPLSHAAALLRQIFMEQSLRELQQSVPLQAVAQIKQNYGVDIAIGSHVLGASEMLLIMTVFGLVFYIASALVMQKNKRN